MKFNSGDVILMEIDTNNWKLKFKNERTNASIEIKVPFIPEIEKDQYKFCVGLSDLKSKVKILSAFD